MFFEESLRIGQRLTERQETVSVAESSTGGIGLLSRGQCRLYLGITTRFPRS
ncbi:MAG: hypothetical protein ACJASJ_001010 [Candidatus Azotimanducaceae bacterium]|jgi:hypothetical protein